MEHVAWIFAVIRFDRSSIREHIWAVNIWPAKKRGDDVFRVAVLKLISRISYPNIVADTALLVPVTTAALLARHRRQPRLLTARAAISERDCFTAMTSSCD